MTILLSFTFFCTTGKKIEALRMQTATKATAVPLPSLQQRCLQWESLFNVGHGANRKRLREAQSASSPANIFDRDATSSSEALALGVDSYELVVSACGTTATSVLHAPTCDAAVPDSATLAQSCERHNRLVAAALRGLTMNAS